MKKDFRRSSPRRSRKHGTSGKIRCNDGIVFRKFMEHRFSVVQGCSGADDKSACNAPSEPARAVIRTFKLSSVQPFRRKVATRSSAARCFPASPEKSRKGQRAYHFRFNPMFLNILPNLSSEDVKNLAFIVKPFPKKDVQQYPPQVSVPSLLQRENRGNLLSHKTRV